MTQLLPFRLSYGQKLFLIATVPLIVAVAAISLLVAYQSRQLAEREIATLEATLIETTVISGPNRPPAQMRG